MIPSITTRLTIDSAGRVVIPKPLRDQLDLAPGDTLELEADGEKMTLRPARIAAQLSKEKGVWVFRTGQPLAEASVDNVLDQLRSERDAHSLGVTG